ncbi:hypothetical protein LTR08_002078 [Meristemomyces frigidus]|nr:hypothetical protein LTR08_002078 [Meristemomyces frigidus]
MPKRKREADAEAEDGRPGAQQQRVQYKLKQTTVKLGHAFKIAKGFERQKLGRRRQTAVAEKEEKTVQRIDAEIGALKTLDTTACAKHHLYKTLAKIKVVTEAPSLPPEVSKLTTLSTDAAALNVHGRLCNSNPVKEALPAALSEIGGALGVKIGEAATAKKKRLRAQDYEKAAESDVGKVERKAKAAPQPQQGAASDGSDGDDDGGVALESDDELEQYGARLASSDEDDNSGSDEDLDVDALERKLASEGIRSTKPSSLAPPTLYNHAADLSLSPSSANPSPSPEPQKAPALKKSAFLPSLTMGGYISGSGSDPDSDIDVAPKKNRRGQRARQQIAEKKFGQKAKHLQKPPAEQPTQRRNEGWDAKRGATDGRGHDRRGGRSDGAGQSRVGASVRASGAPTGMNAQPVGEKKVDHRDDGGAIHPSWEAAKRAKERKEQGAVAFQGKKITFD